MVLSTLLLLQSRVEWRSVDAALELISKYSLVGSTHMTQIRRVSSISWTKYVVINST